MAMGGPARLISVEYVVNYLEVMCMRARSVSSSEGRLYDWTESTRLTFAKTQRTRSPLTQRTEPTRSTDGATPPAPQRLTIHGQWQRLTNSRTNSSRWRPACLQRQTNDDIRGETKSATKTQAHKVDQNHQQKHRYTRWDKIIKPPRHTILNVLLPQQFSWEKSNKWMGTMYLP